MHKRWTVQIVGIQKVHVIYKHITLKSGIEKPLFNYQKVEKKIWVIFSRVGFYGEEEKEMQKVEMF